MEKAGMNRRKLFTLIVLVIGILPFLVISLAPLIGSIFRTGPTAPITTPSPTAQAADTVKKYEAEETGYQAVLEREPDNIAALEGLINARLQLIGLGKRPVETIITPLERLTTLNPTQPQYAVLLAQAQEQAGKPEEAARTYQTVLDKNPTNINALRGLAQLELKQERPEAALGLVQDAIQSLKAAPETPESQENLLAVNLILGDIYMSRQDYAQALTHFTQLAQDHPNDFRPILGQAIALKSEGKSADAAPLFNQAVSLAPPQVKDQIKRLAAANTPNTATSPAPSSTDSPTPAP
ncbi:lipopolysaccharide assembly protein LapB [Synechococcus sp. PCC 6312]|uniref:tetratricopeptide repeat protein n=1 Tax=Synechococcus sp. (strain ATCC 27167 / PCC 6312) TaxID=195253 RepID=UPI00029F1542|nr:tetratricopeptide repeat protein [Synechococcus sp. PCC 6312]AFY60627.1 hypothetical protein Syn6312_1459 [Synechococcus sp. PCC 6312]